jgi:hypothetical protein
VLVILPAGAHPNRPADGNADVNSGDVVDVSGTVQKAPDATQAKQKWVSAMMMRKNFNRAA